MKTRIIDKNQTAYDSIKLSLNNKVETPYDQIYFRMQKKFSLFKSVSFIQEMNAKSLPLPPNLLQLNDDNNNSHSPVKMQNLYSSFRRSGVMHDLPYKLLKRVYRFGAQEVIKDNLMYYFNHYFQANFGPHYLPVALACSASFFVGLIEAPTNLPIDILSTYVYSNQVQRFNLKINEIFISETTRFRLGFKWGTVANVVGNVSLFTSQAYLEAVIQKSGQNPNGEAEFSYSQKIGISSVSALTSVLLSYPLFLIKENVETADKTLVKKNHFSQVYNEIKKNRGRHCQAMFFKTAALAATMVILDEMIERTKGFFD